MNIYYLFVGVAIACFIGCLYKLINKSYVKKPDQTQYQYFKDLKYQTGLVFIILGAGQIITGILMNRFSDKFNKYRLATFGALMV